MRIKSKDIAKVLNVSSATVSLALNNKPGIKEETKNKILSYVEDLENQERVERDLCNFPKEGTVLMLNYIKSGVILERSDKNPPLLQDIKRLTNYEGYNFLCISFYEKVDKLEGILEQDNETIIPMHPFENDALIILKKNNN